MVETGCKGNLCVLFMVDVLRCRVFSRSLKACERLWHQELSLMAQKNSCELRCIASYRGMNSVANANHFQTRVNHLVLAVAGSPWRRRSVNASVFFGFSNNQALGIFYFRHSVSQYFSQTPFLSRDLYLRQQQRGSEVVTSEIFASFVSENLEVLE